LVLPPFCPLDDILNKRAEEISFLEKPLVIKFVSTKKDYKVTLSMLESQTSESVNLSLLYPSLV